MAKITRHVCDFNANLADHDAQVQIIIDDKSEDRRLDLDACAKHLPKMIAELFINNPKARTIFVSKMTNGSLDVSTPAKGRAYDKKPCPAGCDRKIAPQGLRFHLQQAHPDYVAK